MIQTLYKCKEFLKQLYIYPSLQQAELSYDCYWQEKKKGALGVPNSFQVDRADFIADRIQENATILDFGCGDGSILFAILKHKRIQPFGTDISPFILDFLNKNNIKAIEFDMSEKGKLESLGHYDHVLALEVLEHLPKPEEYLLELLEISNKSVFISVPNTGYIQHRLRLLFGKFPLQWRAHPSEHLRFWTIDDFNWWLKSLGLNSRAEVHCYKGVPFLNKIFPSLFAQGIIAEIKAK